MNGFILPSKIMAKAIEKKDKVTQSGIIITAAIAERDPCITAIVTMVGDEVQSKYGINVKEGHTILFSPHAYQKVRIEDADFMLLDARDILYFW